MPAEESEVTTSDLAVRVEDKDGTPLPGVTVTATNPETGFDRVSTTEVDGSCLISALPSGTYRVSAELAGFAPVVDDDVQLLAPEVTVHFTLSQAS